MKKRLTYILFILLAILAISTYSLAEQGPLQHAWFNFDGQWLPDVEPSKIGPNNFRTYQNFRPVPGGIEGVQGDTKINTTAITTYQDIENAHHFNKDQPPESHVITIAGDSGVSYVYDNTTAIPSQGDFSSTTLYAIDTSALQVRMSDAPNGHITVLDGKESLIWGGDEMPVAAFFTSESAVTDDTINARDYTSQVNNNLSTADEVAIIGGGNDDETKSLLHFDGIDGSQTFTESASGTTETRTWNVDTTAQIDTDQKKFGTAAGFFDGGTSIYAADSVDWHPANGDGSGNTFYTIDLWFRSSVDDPSKSYGIFNQYANAGDDHHYVFISSSANQIKWEYRNGGVIQQTITAETDPLWEKNKWHHLALINGWGGVLNQYAITLDGVVDVIDSDATTLIKIDSNIEIGVYTDIFSGASNFFTGWIDEFRITRGKARWTSNFNPPARPYSAEANNWVVFTNRPISGISHYVVNGNTLSGQTVTYTYWNGSSWSGVSVIAGSGATNDPTFGLSQSGKITWASTVDTAKPKYLEGKLFYAYQGELSDGEATIFNITVDAPMQPIVDLWDGVFRQPISFQTIDSSGTSDWTREVKEGSSRIFPIGAQMGGITSSDQTIIIFDDRMQAVRFQFLEINETATPDLSGASVGYWNGSDYADQSSQYDQTTQDGVPLNKTGTISWQPPNREEEFKQTLYGVEGYAYRFVWNGTLDSAGDASATLIDLVFGIPAPIKVRPFKFAMVYKKRLLLAGYTEGNKGNRIDYSVTNTTEAWNGLESSMDGIQSIDVGGNEDLTAGVQIYNRYGSNIITGLVLLKKTQTYFLIGDGPTGDNKFKVLPISNNIGCPAPLTLATAEISYEVAESQATRNLAMWLSYSGPMLFDGAVIIPLGGIDSFFDPADVNYVGAVNIENAVGWYDITYKEYNLRVGAKWFVFSFIEKKWFEKYTPTMPTVGFQVADVNGSKYTYSGVTTGFLMRQENGTTWAETGNGIEQIIRTGDFFPVFDKNGQFDPWYTTRLRRLKVGYRVMSENVTLDINYYLNSSVTPTALSGVPLSSGDNTYNRNTQALNLLGWQHGLEFKATTSSTDKGARLQGYGYQYWIEREDEN